MARYIGATPRAKLAVTGGTVTTSGDYQIHTFLASGTLTVSDAASRVASLAGWGAQPAVNSVDGDYYLIGGGSGGTGGTGTHYGNAGAAGVAREGAAQIPIGSHPVVVGAGGAKSDTAPSSPGSSSSLGSLVTATGGHAASNSGRTGASNDDHIGGTLSTGTDAGGGAGSGTDGSTNAGGSGTATLLSGASQTFGGGGGAGRMYDTGGGGLGGGGDGTGLAGVAGSANTGSGGGGGGNGGSNGGGNGGSGRVVVRVPLSEVV